MKRRDFKVQSLAAETWSECQKRHLEAVRPFTGKFRNWRGKGGLHPIYDFLFTYYTFSTMKLERWHPGYGVRIESLPDSVASSLLSSPLYRRSGDAVGVFADTLRLRELRQLVWVRALCKTMLERTERFACFGLHEWAIVYRAPDKRHDYPLRLTPKEIENVVEGTKFCCSHYDAFRFSSESAQKLNVLQPGPEDRLEFEQAGCLHANMDLYKWAFKLSPLISSDLLRDCFFLALRAREIDMRASPYDFTSIGFQPICIETFDGQAEYRREQEKIAAEARELRQALLDAAEAVIFDLPADRRAEGERMENWIP